MVPFAVEPASGGIVIHVSGLAAHAQYIRVQPMVSMLVMQSEVKDQPVHALQRVTLQGIAVPIQRDSAQWQSCRTAYLQRFPDAEPMTQLGDFRFVLLDIQGARQVAGFGTARSIDQEDIRNALIASTNISVT
jgi:putative heme iron utilization protein